MKVKNSAKYQVQSESENQATISLDNRISIKGLIESADLNPENIAEELRVARENIRQDLFRILMIQILPKTISDFSGGQLPQAITSSTQSSIENESDNKTAINQGSLDSDQEMRMNISLASNVTMTPMELFFHERSAIAHNITQAVIDMLDSIYLGKDSSKVEYAADYTDDSVESYSIQEAA